MKQLIELLKELSDREIKLRIQGQNIGFHGRTTKLDAKIKDALASHKQELLAVTKVFTSVVSVVDREGYIIDHQHYTRRIKVPAIIDAILCYAPMLASRLGIKAIFPRPLYKGIVTVSNPAVNVFDSCDVVTIKSQLVQMQDDFRFTYADTFPDSWLNRGAIMAVCGRLLSEHGVFEWPCDFNTFAVADYIEIVWHHKKSQEVRA